MKFWTTYIIVLVLIIMIGIAFNVTIINSDLPLWLKIMLLK